MIRPPAPAAHARVDVSGWGWSLALAAILVLGGGNWTMPLPRFLAQLIGTGLLICALARGPMRGKWQPGTPDWIVVAMLALFALHLLPLPPALWTALPGRGAALEVDRALLGAPGWRPLTLDREATLRAALMLVPALAVYVAGRLGDGARHRALLRGVLVALAAATALALAQAAAPDAAWLHPYPRGDYAWPVGFFTNRNHHAASACMALPLAALWLRGHGKRRRVLAGLSLLAAALVLATTSRAGAALLLIALSGTWLADRPAQPRAFGMALGLGLAAALASGMAVVALGGDGLLGVLRRDSPLADARLDYWPLVADAAAAFWPVGSGLGTFLTGYEMMEPLDSLGPLYLNHAHNDYLEIALEAGVPGLVLPLIATWELLVLALPAWRSGGAVQHRLAGIALMLPLLHALVDYPLRTVTLSCLFALAVALLIATPEPE